MLISYHLPSRSLGTVEMFVLLNDSISFSQLSDDLSVTTEALEAESTRDGNFKKSRERNIFIPSLM